MVNKGEKRKEEELTKNLGLAAKTIILTMPHCIEQGTTFNIL